MCPLYIPLIVLFPMSDWLLYTHPPPLLDCVGNAMSYLSLHTAHGGIQYTLAELGASSI